MASLEHRWRPGARKAIDAIRALFGYELDADPYFVTALPGRH